MYACSPHRLLTENVSDTRLQVVGIEEQAKPFHPGNAARFVLYLWDGSDTVLGAVGETAIHLRTGVRRLCRPASLRLRALPALRRAQSGALSEGAVSENGPICSGGGTFWLAHEPPGHGSFVPLLLLGPECEVGTLLPLLVSPCSLPPFVLFWCLQAWG
jgi:hypothetical protein